MPVFWTKGTPQAAVRIERLIAVAAIGLTAFGFAQPQVLSLAGLDFGRPSNAHTLVAHAIDPLPTGSLQSPTANTQIHGLAGTLKPLRHHD